MADVVVCGGTEACVTQVTMAAFARMGALSRNPDHARASRPFDDDRDGFVMGEGAAFLVLEPYERAVDRGARILGEVSGYGLTCDAHHITAPVEDGAGAAAAMEMALADAGLAPAAIGHVNAHGTSTPHNDSAEAAAIAKVFGPGPSRSPRARASRATSSGPPAPSKRWPRCCRSTARRCPRPPTTSAPSCPSTSWRASPAASAGRRPCRHRSPSVATTSPWC